MRESSEQTRVWAMAESLPVVTLPGEDEGGAGAGGIDIAPEDILVLHEVVVEELLVAEGEAGTREVPLGFVTEPVEDVIVLGSEEDEDEEVGEVVERVAAGPPRGGMATDAGIHPVSVPTALPVEEVPPDETMTVDMVADKTIADGEEGGDNDEAKVVSEVTVVEEVVTTVEEVVEATGEVVEKTVKVDEMVSVSETVVEGDAMETDGEKADKKRLRDGEEDAAVKKLKADAGQAEGKEEEKVVEPKKLGPRVFNSGVEMFTYFYNLLHDWNVNQNVNKVGFSILETSFM